MGRNTIPRSASTLMVDQTLTPVRSCLGSVVPFGVTGLAQIAGWCETSKRVFQREHRNARTAPLGPLEGYSGHSAPTIARSLYMAGGEVTEYTSSGHRSAKPRRSTLPESPKSGRGFPVAASSAIKRPSKVPNRIRRSDPSVFCQMPPRDAREKRAVSALPGGRTARFHCLFPGQVRSHGSTAWKSTRRYLLPGASLRTARCDADPELMAPGFTSPVR